MIGDNMKKIILSGIFFIGIGFILGNIIFEKNSFFKNSHQETYYFLQEGVYSNKDILQNNLKDLANKLIDYQEDKFYVYIGITKDLDVAEKLQNIYEEKGYKIIKKEKNINSEEFSVNVDQFDLLIKSTKDEDQILTIEEVVLANYEEIIKKK